MEAQQNEINQVAVQLNAENIFQNYEIIDESYHFQEVVVQQHEKQISLQQNLKDGVQLAFKGVAAVTDVGNLIISLPIIVPVVVVGGVVGGIKHLWKKIKK